MKIHIISTPNVNHDDLNSILDTLSQVDGDMKFLLVGDFLNEQQYPRFAPKFNNATTSTKLEFSDFYNYCKEYRQSINNKGEDIVVFITTVANEYNYFSAVEGKNIFVYTGFWDNIVGVKRLYAVAYNILVNVFQSLLEISYLDVNNRHIHKENIGCINDFCEKREQVVLKLRSGYICDKCIEEAILKIPNDMLLQFYQLILKIRVNFMNYDKVTALFEPEVLTIHEDGKITIGDKILYLTLLQRTYYIFFLKHLDGFEFSKLNDHLKEINSIYHYLRLNSLKSYSHRINRDNINNENLIASIPIANFQYHKSSLKSRLIEQLGIHKSNFYLIKNFHEKFENSSKSVFKIDLPKTKINNRFKLL